MVSLTSSMIPFNRSLNLHNNYENRFDLRNLKVGFSSPFARGKESERGRGKKTHNAALNIGNKV
jgi:hypothetical protein